VVLLQWRVGRFRRDVVKPLTRLLALAVAAACLWMASASGATFSGIFNGNGAALTNNNGGAIATVTALNSTVTVTPQNNAAGYPTNFVLSATGSASGVSSINLLTGNVSILASNGPGTIPILVLLTNGQVFTVSNGVTYASITNGVNSTALAIGVNATNLIGVLSTNATNFALWPSNWVGGISTNLGIVAASIGAYSPYSNSIGANYSGTNVPAGAQAIGASNCLFSFTPTASMIGAGNNGNALFYSGQFYYNPWPLTNFTTVGGNLVLLMTGSNLDVVGAPRDFSYGGLPPIPGQAGFYFEVTAQTSANNTNYWPGLFLEPYEHNNNYMDVWPSIPIYHFEQWAEFDIFEYFNGNAIGTVHSWTGQPQTNGNIYNPNNAYVGTPAMNVSHTYGMSYQPTNQTATWWIDGVLDHSATIPYVQTNAQLEHFYPIFSSYVYSTVNGTATNYQETFSKIQCFTPLVLTNYATGSLTNGLLAATQLKAGSNINFTVASGVTNVNVPSVLTNISALSATNVYAANVTDSNLTSGSLVVAGASGLLLPVTISTGLTYTPGSPGTLTANGTGSGGTNLNVQSNGVVIGTNIGILNNIAGQNFAQTITSNAAGQVTISNYIPTTLTNVTFGGVTFTGSVTNLGTWTQQGQLTLLGGATVSPPSFLTNGWTTNGYSMAPFVDWWFWNDAQNNYWAANWNFTTIVFSNNFEGLLTNVINVLSPQTVGLEINTLYFASCYKSGPNYNPYRFTNTYYLTNWWVNFIGAENASTRWEPEKDNMAMIQIYSATTSNPGKESFQNMRWDIGGFNGTFTNTTGCHVFNTDEPVFKGIEFGVPGFAALWFTADFEAFRSLTVEDCIFTMGTETSNSMAILCDGPSQTDQLHLINNKIFPQGCRGFVVSNEVFTTQIQGNQWQDVGEGAFGYPNSQSMGIEAYAPLRNGSISGNNFLFYIGGFQLTNGGPCITLQMPAATNLNLQVVDNNCQSALGANFCVTNGNTQGVNIANNWVAGTNIYPDNQFSNQFSAGTAYINTVYWTNAPLIAGTGVSLSTSAGSTTITATGGVGSGIALQGGQGSNTVLFQPTITNGYTYGSTTNDATEYFPGLSGASFSGLNTAFTFLGAPVSIGSSTGPVLNNLNVNGQVLMGYNGIAAGPTGEAEIAYGELLTENGILNQVGGISNAGPWVTTFGNGYAAVTPNDCVWQTNNTITNKGTVGTLLWTNSDCSPGNGFVGSELLTINCHAACSTNQNTVAFGTSTNNYWGQYTFGVVITNGTVESFGMIGSSNTTGAAVSGLYLSNNAGGLQLYAQYPGTQPQAPINTVVNKQTATPSNPWPSGTP
jgi:hypothetical protein